MEVGIRGHKELEVTYEQSAAKYGSGTLEVFATPAMVALAEGTALELVQPHLDAGQGTVGISVYVKHLAATPVGESVRCECELTEIDRRRLVFAFEVFDKSGKVGEGTHERFIIDNEKFLANAANR